MKSGLLVLAASFLFAAHGYSQVYSFEDPQQTQGWTIERGDIACSKAKFKLGTSSLKIDWQPQAVVRIDKPMGLDKASKSVNGGIAAWIYNETPVKDEMLFVFKDEAGGEVCSVAFGMNFKGWRCLWNKFVEDMGKDRKTGLASVEIRFPESAEGGVTYLDYLEFSPKVSWQKMTDAHVKTNRTDFSLVLDLMKYRNAVPDPSKMVDASAQEIGVIGERLEQWYLGSGSSNHVWVKRRAQKEGDYIRKGVRASKKYALTEALYPMSSPKNIEGEKVTYFMDLNKNVLLPLALDYRKNKNEESLQRALAIYDWFNDQGWADGSALGTLCFEKLRSSGYFHSFFLLKDKLSPEQLQRELNTMRWMTLFGICYLEPEHPGEVADNLRALALPKLVYALSLTDERERKVALTAFRDYMNSALGYGPGYFGTFKSDGSGYHHRGAYNSAYYPHALYVGALVAYLLHDTPYALSDNTLHILKRGLLTYRFLSANLSVPAGTVGRFPKGQKVLQELLPAFAYTAYAFDEPDTELLAAVKRLALNNKAEVEKVLDDVNSNLSYTATVGEAELLAKAVTGLVQPEEAPAGSLFMPYSGLLIAKNSHYHFNVKGFSKYIWDYESSNTENLAGRYLSNGQVEYFNLETGKKSFNPEIGSFDWSYIPGTTSIVMPYDELKKKKHLKGYSDHRNYSDESFLAGVAAADNVAMFSFRMHDRAFNNTFRANKSVFLFDDVLMCMGSDIRNNDEKNHTVTTLFQSYGDEALGKVRKSGGGVMLADHAGIVYAVKGDNITLSEQAPFTRACIDHATAPESASYLYYMVTESGKKAAGKLLSSSAPVEVLRQDNDAHIVRHKDKGIVYAALFNDKIQYPELKVTKVNIPLAYIWQDKGGKQATLSVCEPDMRRPAVNHMGDLTEADVIVPEKPFATRLHLQGIYEAACQDGDMKVTHADGETIIDLTTICGKNYTILLTAK